MYKQALRLNNSAQTQDVFVRSTAVSLGHEYRNDVERIIKKKFPLLAASRRSAQHLLKLMIVIYLLNRIQSLARWASLLQSQLQQLVKHLPVRWIPLLPPSHHNVNHHKKERQTTALRQRRRRKCHIGTTSCSCLHKQYFCHK